MRELSELEQMAHGPREDMSPKVIQDRPTISSVALCAICNKLYYRGYALGSVHLQHYDLMQYIKEYHGNLRDIYKSDPSYLTPYIYEASSYDDEGDTREHLWVTEPLAIMVLCALFPVIQVRLMQDHTQMLNVITQISHSTGYSMDLVDVNVVLPNTQAGSYREEDLDALFDAVVRNT